METSSKTAAVSPTPTKSPIRPWHVYQEKPHYYSIGGKNSSGDSFNVVRDVRREDYARLIAAAPEMLAALKAVSTHFMLSSESADEWQELVWQAIAKAETSVE